MNTSGELPWEVVYPPGVRTVHAGDRRRDWLLPVLVPASWLYQAASNAVRSVRSAGARRAPDGLCVVSVGNLEVGGSGKTPLSMHLVAGIAAAGGRPVYVSRGFGGIAERIDVVTVVPGTSDEAPITRHAGVRGLRRGMAGLSAEVGDEGAMVARRLPEVPLLFCRDKWRALDLAAKTLNPTHAVMDDAFQSWGVPRDIDIVLVDGGRPIGDGWTRRVWPSRASRLHGRRESEYPRLVFAGGSTSFGTVRRGGRTDATRTPRYPPLGSRSFSKRTSRANAKVLRFLFATRIITDTARVISTGLCGRPKKEGSIPSLPPKRTGRSYPI